MKTITGILTATLLLGATAPHALARSIMLPALGSTLTTLNIDPNLAGAQDAKSGFVLIFPSQGFVKLVLPQEVPCTADGICLTVMPHEYVVELPVVSDTVNRCGSRVIVASLDKRPVDGGLQTLTVTDYTGDQCAYDMVLPATEVVYETAHYSHFEGKEVTTFSSFTGDALVSVRNR
jgi:hypothetical protein